MVGAVHQEDDAVDGRQVVLPHAAGCKASDRQRAVSLPPGDTHGDTAQGQPCPAGCRLILVEGGSTWKGKAHLEPPRNLGVGAAEGCALKKASRLAFLLEIRQTKPRDKNSATVQKNNPVTSKSSTAKNISGSRA